MKNRSLFSIFFTNNLKIPRWRQYPPISQNPSMSDNTNLKQTIIQTIMSKPYLTAEQLDHIINPLHTNRTQFIQETNQTLAPLGLVLRAVISDYDDVEYYGICEVYEDINGKESLGIRAEIVQLFYRYLDMIINAPSDAEIDTSIGKILDLAPDGISSLAAQDGLKILQSYGYVEIINDKVRIGPRGLLEFRPKFSQKTSDGEESGLKTCQICLDFILAGKKCPRCTCCMHRRCYDRYAANRESVQCPACQCKEPYIEFGM